MPRFVVLTHDHPVLHWDLMLEARDSLRTWRLSHPPNSAEEISADPLQDHRRDYLDYEGPVSRGRGEVRRWDAGEYRLLEESETGIEIRLNGGLLNGIAAIEQLADDGGSRFHFIAD